MIDDTLKLCGTVVAEKYEILEVVGRGGFALVYRARHLQWNRPVAMKVFKAQGGATNLQTMTADLVKEASVLAELSEKTASICQARDLGTLTTPDGQALPYMVLEWLEGETLAQTLFHEHQAKLPPRSLAATVKLLDPIAEALAFAHTRGVAHRDVKPANVFLATDGKGGPTSVKLLDFGIAKVVQDAQKTGGAFHQTQGVVTSFTPNYGAPEQFSRRFGATGPWTDVYALGLVVLETSYGGRLFATNDFMELATAATERTRRPTPRLFGLTVNDATEAVFAKALAVEPAERYDSAGAFWSALLTSLALEPSRTFQNAFVAKEHDLFAGLAATQPAPDANPPAPSVTNSGPANSGKDPRAVAAQATTFPVTPRPETAHPGAPRPVGSGKLVLTVVAVAGILFVGGMYALLRYDRANNGPPAAGAANADVDPPSRLRARASATASASPPASALAAGSAAASAPKTACPSGMVLIPGGEFFMGADDGTEAEKPSHHVELSPYCIDLYEVTTARYEDCSEKGKCRRAPRANEWTGITQKERDVFDPLCSVRDVTGLADHPIVCVDWFMADTFCKTLPGGRLPTEAEWEFAARGADGRKYPWGDDPPSGELLNACGAECVAWGKTSKTTLTAMYVGDDSWPNTSQVGAFPRGKSRFGLFDMAGNVWEWVADWRAPYAKDAVKNPTGPASGTLKITRGGAWNGSAPAWVSPTFRSMNTPDAHSYGIGFRCAATPSTGEVGHDGG